MATNSAHPYPHYYFNPSKHSQFDISNRWTNDSKCLHHAAFDFRNKKNLAAVHDIHLLGPYLRSLSPESHIWILKDKRNFWYCWNGNDTRIFKWSIPMTEKLFVNVVLMKKNPLDLERLLTQFITGRLPVREEISMGPEARAKVWKEVQEQIERQKAFERNRLELRRLIEIGRRKPLEHERRLEAVGAEAEDDGVMVYHLDAEKENDWSDHDDDEDDREDAWSVVDEDIPMHI